jgi:hypothetical protein
MSLRNLRTVAVLVTNLLAAYFPFLFAAAVFCGRAPRGVFLIVACL